MISDSDPPGKDDPPDTRREPDVFAENRLRNPFAPPPPLRDPFLDDEEEEQLPPEEEKARTERDTAPLRDLVQSYRTEARAQFAAQQSDLPPVAPQAEPPSYPQERPRGPEPRFDEPRREPEPGPGVLPAPPVRHPEPRGWFGRKLHAPPPPPPPPPGNKGKKKMSRSERSRSPFIAGANAAFTILILAMLGTLVLVHYGMKAFDAPGPLQAETDIAVPPRAGVGDIADRLEQANAISNSLVFKVGAVATGNRGKLQAGEYRIPAQASMRQIMEMMAEGQVVEHTVTIPEGLTSKQIVDRLLSETILSGTVRTVPPEGTLLPETYKVTRGTSRESLLQRMSAAQNKLLDAVWAKRNSKVPVKSPQELVTLASIVEKETGIASERPQVASVFVNRLNKKMRLQSDPTIIYGLVGGAGTLGRPILRSEIARATPYNTYAISGLPPGPIANPGRASLEAAANPADTKYLYFVADGSGGHAFAETLAQHNANVARWRALERADNDRAPVDTVPADAVPPAPPAN